MGTRVFKPISSQQDSYPRRWIGGALLGLMAVAFAGAAAAGDPVPSALRLTRPTLLPPPGTGVAKVCRPGDVTDVEWATSGELRLVAEVVRDVSSLCTYRLEEGRDGEVNSTRAGRPRVGAATNDSVQRLGAREVFGESEARWAPPLQSRAPSTGCPVDGGKMNPSLLFTSSVPGSPERIFGTSDPLNGQASVTTVFEYDGRGPNVRGTGRQDMYMAAWRNLAPLPEPEPGFAAVSHVDLSCGRSRIVYVPRPTCGGQSLQPGHNVPLTNPCEDQRPGANTADRYPAWGLSADSKQERLAFVRSDGGLGSRVCITPSQRQLPTALDSYCFTSVPGAFPFIPAFTQDGRWLVWFEATNDREERNQGGTDGLANVMGVDLRQPGCGTWPPSAECKSQKITTGVRTNGSHGPTTFMAMGAHWLLTSVQKKDLSNPLLLTSLDQPGRQTEIPSGLSHVRAVAAIPRGDKIQLALVARGEQGVVGADLENFKIYVTSIPAKGW